MCVCHPIMSGEVWADVNKRTNSMGLSAVGYSFLNEAIIVFSIFDSFQLCHIHSIVSGSANDIIIARTHLEQMAS